MNRIKWRELVDNISKNKNIPNCILGHSLGKGA